MDKTTFLTLITNSRLALEAAIATLTPTQQLQPGASGEMSVKDMLAHITWHEREMIGLIDQMALVGSEWWQLPTDERNAYIFALNRQRSWDEVWAEAQDIYPRLFAALQALDEAAYTDPGCYQHMPPDWAPWQVFAGNTFEHYDHHLADLKAGLTLECAFDE